MIIVAILSGCNRTGEQSIGPIKRKTHKRDVTIVIKVTLNTA